MTEDFKAYAAREMVLSEAKRKKGEDDGLNILDLRRFVINASKFTKDKELLHLLAGFHNILARMESKKAPKKNLAQKNKNARR